MQILVSVPTMRRVLRLVFSIASVANVHKCRLKSPETARNFARNCLEVVRFRENCFCVGFIGGDFLPRSAAWQACFCCLKDDLPCPYLLRRQAWKTSAALWHQRAIVAGMNVCRLWIDKLDQPVSYCQIRRNRLPLARLPQFKQFLFPAGWTHQFQSWADQKPVRAGRAILRGGEMTSPFRRQRID